ncbi:hypothetical protein DFP93_101235 [Aneurinibacillus soli]|uniref:Uncharacterized protein n=1 Tax=Aneurinibacillus soli TaxID=1500254 RepID=A0A0U5B439_9BACL|nr:hypothetical protein [Aneurinibacillus soli]PYE64210.1 hypothetical protein DFP93_101235 [Aneurinibacillus soli]BAU28159.1 hypothetical protein CB4_02333 [Aneurinibacillus soli]
MDTEQQALEIARKMNEEAVQRVGETITEQKEDDKVTSEQAEQNKKVWMETGEPFTFRDGKTYYVQPSALADAFEIMDILSKINVSLVIANFMPTGDAEKDKERIGNVYRIMELAFKQYGLTREYIDQNVDVVMASRIIEAIAGMNGLLKV